MKFYKLINFRIDSHTQLMSKLIDTIDDSFSSSDESKDYAPKKNRSEEVFIYSDKHRKKAKHRNLNTASRHK